MSAFLFSLEPQHMRKNLKKGFRFFGGKIEADANLRSERAK